MMFGTERRGITLRLSGIAALGLAAVAAHALFGGDRPGAVSAADLLLALILFAAGCSGGALFLLGDHLLDRVDVSARWRHRNTPERDHGTERAPGEDGMKLLRELAATPSPTPAQAARIWALERDRGGSRRTMSVSTR